MLRLRLSVAVLIAGVAGVLMGARHPEAAAPEIRWKKTVLDTQFRSEGVTVADINQDGKLDIIAGNAWYEAPDWKRHEIFPLKEFDAAKGYSNCFLTFAMDIDKDGYPDVIVIGFPGDKAVWWRNPGKSGGPWMEHVITESACNESPIFADLTGDGVPVLITPFKESRMAYYRPGPDPTRPWIQHFVGEPNSPGCKRFSHGLGVGDVNGDGRADIICTEGYYQAPLDLLSGKWTFKPANLGDACAQMYTYDFNGDGLPDVISSSAHKIGLWWYEQVPGSNGTEFRQHLIDDTFSQSHALMMADINGDGQPDFVTGKRWWAHGPNGDVNPNDPAVLYWYEFRRNNGKVEWIRHEIDRDSGVGTQFAIADVNGNGLLDIVISNKKGVFLFEQVR